MKKIIFLFILLSFISPNVFAKNSKDVSNIKVQKKTISHKQKYSLQLVDSKDGHPVRSGDKPYPSMVVYFDEVNQGTSKEKVVKNLGN